MNAFPPLTLESCKHPKSPASNHKHIPHSPEHKTTRHEHSPGKSQDRPIGMYAVAPQAIAVTDTIIEVGEMNFVFVARRVLRFDDLSYHRRYRL